MAERALRRVARMGDGWMTTLNTPESFHDHLTTIRTYAAEEGRELPAEFEACLYYNINVNPDRQAAMLESKRFLDAYYSVDYRHDVITRWVATGSVEECVEHASDTEPALQSPSDSIHPSLTTDVLAEHEQLGPGCERIAQGGIDRLGQGEGSCILWKSLPERARPRIDRVVLSADFGASCSDLAAFLYDSLR